MVRIVEGRGKLGEALSFYAGKGWGPDREAFAQCWSGCMAPYVGGQEDPFEHISDLCDALKCWVVPGAFFR